MNSLSVIRQSWGSQTHLGRAEGNGGQPGLPNGGRMPARAPDPELQPVPKRDVCPRTVTALTAPDTRPGGGTEAEKLLSVSVPQPRWAGAQRRVRAAPAAASRLSPQQQVGNNREMPPQQRPERNKAYLMGHTWNANTKTWNPNKRQYINKLNPTNFKLLKKLRLILLDWSSSVPLQEHPS